MRFPRNGLLESFLYSLPLLSFRERSWRDGRHSESVARLGISVYSMLQNPQHILLEESRCREDRGENTENNLSQETHPIDWQYTKDFSTSPLSFCSSIWAEPPLPPKYAFKLYFKTDMDAVYKKHAAKPLPRCHSPQVINKSDLECLVWVLFRILILTW